MLGRDSWKAPQKRKPTPPFFPNKHTMVKRSSFYTFLWEPRNNFCQKPSSAHVLTPSLFQNSSLEDRPPSRTWASQGCVGLQPARSWKPGTKAWRRLRPGAATGPPACERGDAGHVSAVSPPGPEPACQGQGQGGGGRPDTLLRQPAQLLVNPPFTSCMPPLTTTRAQGLELPARLWVSWGSSVALPGAAPLFFTRTRCSPNPTRKMTPPTGAGAGGAGGCTRCSSVASAPRPRDSRGWSS